MANKHVIKYSSNQIVDSKALPRSNPSRVVDKTFKVAPWVKGRLRRIPAPTDSLSYELFQRTVHAVQKAWTVQLFAEVEGIERLYQFLVIDGSNHRFDVEMVDGVIWQCSCASFVDDGLGHCQHTLLLKLMLSKSHEFSCGTLFLTNVNKRKFLQPYRACKFSYSWVDTLAGMDGPWQHRLEIIGKGRKGRVGDPAFPLVESVTFKQLLNSSSGVGLRQSVRVVYDDGSGASEAPAAPCSDGILRNGLRLYDYQEGIFAGMLVARRAICSMRMGSGKTLTSLACYGWLRNHGVFAAESPSCSPGKGHGHCKLLIICPKSLKLQWKSELKRSLGLDGFCVDNTKHLGMVSSHEVLVVTYQFFTKHVEEFAAKTSYSLVIMDEIQNVRNSETKTWRAAKQLKSEYFFGLSGTVIENRLDDLYSVMDVIAPGHLGHKWQFCNDHQNLVAISRTNIVFGGAKNLELLHEKLKGRVFGYDNLELPEITHRYIATKMNQSQRSAHDNYYGMAQQLLAKAMSSGLSHSEKMILQSYLLKARQACNDESLITKKRGSKPSIKVVEIIDAIRTCVANGEKVVLFSQWTEFLDIIAAELVRAKIGSAMFTGRESENQRFKALHEFSSQPNVMVFLSSDAGGVGLDGLQLVSHVAIHTELPWNPARLDQRTGRVHRIGQTKPVSVLYFYASDSIESKMLEVLEGKREIRTIALSLPKE
jgi:superfamily II DNA or RNA helicase